MTNNQSVRAGICRAVCDALKPLPSVLAGWEGGSVAFGAVDDYSDIDLTFIVSDEVAYEVLYASAENALATISPIAVRHDVPPGRYYKLQDVGEFLLVDVCFFRVGALDHHLEIERHGHILPLFDKGEWLRPRPLDTEALTSKRVERLRELQTWFLVSQSFVKKAILRGQHVEAVNAFWAYTLKPLAELLRMRYCPARWDFGMRYLDRDLPPALYDQVRDLAFTSDLADLERKFSEAAAWGAALLWEVKSDPNARTTERK